MRLIKNVGLLCVAFLALVIWSKYHRKASDEAGAAGIASEMRPSPNGFVTLPPPFKPPSGRLVIVAPPNCPSQEGRRADDLVRLLNGDGFPCSRTGKIDITADREASHAEAEQLNRIMLGALPLVFVNGRAKNNPDLAEVEAESRLS